MNEIANPWVVQAPKPAHEPLPPSIYTGVFKGVEAVSIKDKAGADAPRFRFAWEVGTGPHAGKKADALTDRTIGMKALAGRLIAGLLGRPLVPGEDVKASIEACVGKTYLVTVAGGPQGGKPCVRQCDPLKPPQAEGM